MAKIQEIAPELLQFTEAVAPGTPASGVVRIYAKTDGKLYCKDDSGNEFALVGAAAAEVSIADSGELFTATNVEGALAELFTSVSDGKTLVATAITDKGVTTSGTDTFATMATNIGSISGGATLTGDAAVGDVVSGKTFYSDDAESKLTGTLAPSAEDIKSGVTIAGVTGTLESGSYATTISFFNVVSAGVSVFTLS